MILKMTMKNKKTTNKYFSDEKLKDNAVTAAFRYLSYRSRTVFEMKSYMQKKHYDEEIINFAISYLKDLGYLDDHKYCADYLAYQVKYKPKSKFAFGYDLKRKGIRESIISDALMIYEDDDLAIESVKNKIRQWQNFDETVFKKKVMNFLRYRGFDYHTCMATLETLFDEHIGKDK